MYKQRWPKNADNVFNRLPAHVMNSITNQKKKKRDERSRDPYDLAATRTETFNSTKISKVSMQEKSYSRRVSWEANKVKEIFLGDTNDDYVEKRIQCNNSRPVSRGKMRSPLLNKQYSLKYSAVSTSKNSVERSMKDSQRIFKNRRSRSRKPLFRSKKNTVKSHNDSRVLK